MYHARRKIINYNLSVQKHKTISGFLPIVMSLFMLFFMFVVLTHLYLVMPVIFNKLILIQSSMLRNIIACNAGGSNR